MRSQFAEVDARELTSGGLLGWLAEMLHTASDVTDTARLIDIESASSTASGLVEIVSTSNQAARGQRRGEGAKNHLCLKKAQKR